MEISGNAYHIIDTPINSDSYCEFLKNNANLHFTQKKEYYNFLHEVYDYRMVSVLCVDNSDNVVAALHGIVKPLSKCIFTSPFYEYGGIVSVNNINSELFTSALKKYLIKHNMDNWLFNYNYSPELIYKYILIHKRYKVASMKLQTENQLSSSIHRSLRKSIRKAIKSGLTSERVFSDESIIEFYSMYSRHMKEKFGTPPLSLKHFLGLRDLYKSDFWLIKVSKGFNSASFLMSISTGKRMHLLHIVDLKEFRIMQAADFAHWNTFLLAISEKINHIDFGYVRYEGQEKYKLKWGAIIEEVCDSIVYADDRIYSSEGIVKEYVFFRKLWSMLPFKVTLIIGPIIRRLLCR